jgi:hypothetical protein
MDFTLIPRIVYPDGRVEFYSFTFQGVRCDHVAKLDREADIRGPHPVILEGEYTAWREMVDNIRQHGKADLSHTLNYLTLSDWPLKLVAVNDDEGQLDVDRFYRYNQSLQEFFDEGGEVETAFAA